MHRVFISIFFFVLFSTPGQAACICLQCALGTHHMFKTGSSAMLPIYSPGDCPIAHLYSDGLSPERGQAIAFEEDGQVYLFRLIGLPGDQIELKDGIVILNGEPLERSNAGKLALSDEAMRREFDWTCERDEDCEVPVLRETLPDGTSYEILDLRETRLDTTPVFTVPNGYVFVLGDNRDNAADSRLPNPIGRGFVPMDRLIGVFEGE